MTNQNLSKILHVTCLGIPVLALVWLAGAWPTRLGFFSDDWMVLLHPNVGSVTAFADIFTLVSTRPTSAPFIWLAQLLADWSPVRAQILNVVMLGITGLAVGRLTQATLASSRVSHASAMIGLSVSATSFILFPASVGIFAWSTGMLVAIPAVPLFCFGMVLLLSANLTRSRMLGGAALLTLSHLAYEALYFQEFAILAIAYALGRKDIGRKLWILLATIFLINVGCIAYNRLAPGIIHKSFYADWWNLFFGGHLRLAEIYRNATRENASWLGVSLATLLASSLLFARTTIGIVRIMAFYVIVSGAIAAAGILYAFAGYGLAAEGPMARTSLVLTIYAGIGMGILSALAWQALAVRPVSAIAGIASIAAIIIGIGMSSSHRIDEWARAWQFEMTRLSQIPEEIVSLQGNDRAFIAISDTKWQFVAPASAPWEISGAAAWALYNRTGDRKAMADVWNMRSPSFRWYAAFPGWFSRWNGSRFEQGPCGSDAAVYGRSASQTLLWKPGNPKFEDAGASWESNCKID